MIRLENVLKISLQDVLKMSWRRFCKTSWRRLENVLKTYSQDECIGLDQDVLKTSSEDKHERCLQGVFKTSPSRRMFSGKFVKKINVKAPNTFLKKCAEKEFQRKNLTENLNKKIKLDKEILIKDSIKNYYRFLCH